MIVLDSNEASHHPSLSSQLDAETVQPLAYGDVLITGSRGFYLYEIKREKDISGSVQDIKNRLWQQCAGMKRYREDSGVWPHFIFVGDLSKLFWGKGRMTFMQYMGLVRGIIEGWGIPIIPPHITATEGNMVSYLRGVDLWVDSERDWVEPPPFRKKDRELSLFQEDLFACLPGWGRKKARLLLSSGLWSCPLDLYRDVLSGEFEAKVLGHGKKGDSGVKGVGKGLLESLDKVLRTKYGENKDR